MTDQHENKTSPDISEVCHNIRNTYQVLFMFLNELDREEKLFTPDQIRKRLEDDLVLMREAEKTCKTCKGEIRR